MASLRGGQVLWALGTSVADVAVSPLVNVGASPYVCVYVSNAHASIDTTFKIEVSGNAQPTPGRNAVADTADGGLVWYDYMNVKSDGTFTVATFTVVHANDFAFDLSPFAPEFMRLKRTDSGGANTSITAFVTAFGPN